MNTSLINLDTFLNRPGKLSISKHTENEIVKLLELKSHVDSLVDELEGFLSEKMIESGTEFIERERMTITRKVTGRKFSFDPKKAVNDKFKKEIKYFGPNVELIAAYKELHGKLPRGVIDNARKQNIEIKLI